MPRGVGLIAQDVTGALGVRDAFQSDAVQSDSAARADLPALALAQRYDQSPGEKRASLAYARALRASGQAGQANAVLQTAAIKTPKDVEVLAHYGKSLAEIGRHKEAMEVLSRAHSPDRPDARILSTQGAIADELGDPDAALGYHQAALRLAPDDPIILSNLGLSHALAKRLPEAESTLRRAVANPRADGRVRANLALVLGLQGKFAEAEDVAARDLPPAEAAANVAYMRSMISQSNSWKQLRTLDRKPKTDGR